MTEGKFIHLRGSCPVDRPCPLCAPTPTTERECCPECFNEGRGGEWTGCTNMGCACHSPTEPDKFIVTQVGDNPPTVTRYDSTTERESWGDGLEELINNLRRDPSTDSVHIHEFVRSLLERREGDVVASARKQMIEKHSCRFNDGEQRCECYLAALQDIEQIIRSDNKEGV